MTLASFTSHGNRSFVTPSPHHIVKDWTDIKSRAPTDRRLSGKPSAYLSVPLRLCVDSSLRELHRRVAEATEIRREDFQTRQEGHVYSPLPGGPNQTTKHREL